MIENVMSTQHVLTPPISNKSSVNPSGGTFGEALATAQTDDIKVPDKWKTDAPSSPRGWGTQIAADFLRENMGINVEERQPTHRVTAEQKEWLSKRHDLENIHLYITPTNEWQNFIGDLVYLNVLSPTEAENLRMVFTSGKENLRAESGYSVGKLNVGGLGDDEISWLGADGVDNFADWVRIMIEQQQKIIDEAWNRYNNPATRLNEDLEFIQKTSESLANKKECFDVLLKIFE